MQDDRVELGMRGRRALVTGAAGGIGRAVVEELVAEGVRVAMIDRSESVLAAATIGARAPSGAVGVFSADVADEAQVEAAVDGAAGFLGGIDFVVGCAGISGPVGTPLGETSLAEWNRVFAINVTGSFLVLTHALPALRRSDAASVVFVASDSALVAAPGMAPYGASKAALVQFARAAAVELAPDGVRVNTVCPSIVDTPMSRGDLGMDGFETAGYPVQTPAEVAAQIAFLCSPRSRPVNAAAIISDFGFIARSNFPA